MGQPKVATIKHLFAVSGNVCAFPGCDSRLIDPTSGRVIGEICHIKANRAGGPRYDPAQSEASRQSFDNLILLCPSHHSVVDADTDSYTVERLTSLKKKHELGQHDHTTISDEAAHTLIANVENSSIQNGSIIYSVNQSGGQIAHSITNVGYQPKQIPQEAIPEFLNLMQSLPPLAFYITSNILDNQTQFLANQLTDLLQKAGWDVGGESMSMYEGLPKGIVFIVPKKVSQSLSLDILARFLQKCGFHNYLEIVNEDQPATIVVNAV